MYVVMIYSNIISKYTLLYTHTHTNTISKFWQETHYIKEYRTRCLVEERNGSMYHYLD